MPSKCRLSEFLFYKQTHKEEKAVMKTTLLQLIFTGIVSALLAWSVLIPSATAADVSMDQMIDTAKTRADHEAIA